MAHLMFLEDFEGDTQLRRNAPRPEDLPGFAAGFDAGQKAAQQDATQLNAQIVNRLVEMRFGYAEAKQDLLRGLAPFVNAICDQILPDILDDVTRSKLIESLIVAGEADLSAPIRITTHPDKRAALETALHAFDPTMFELMHDPQLAADEIIVGTGGQETQLDVSAMISDLRAALAMISPTFNRNG